MVSMRMSSSSASVPCMLLPLASGTIIRIVSSSWPRSPFVACTGSTTANSWPASEKRHAAPLEVITTRATSTSLKHEAVTKGLRPGGSSATRQPSSKSEKVRLRGSSTGADLQMSARGAEFSCNVGGRGIQRGATGAKLPPCRRGTIASSPPLCGAMARLAPSWRGAMISARAAQLPRKSGSSSCGKQIRRRFNSSSCGTSWTRFKSSPRQLEACINDKTGCTMPTVCSSRATCVTDNRRRFGAVDSSQASAKGSTKARFATNAIAK
mmetsp:Transcript_43316/g.119804  ORF Transcript_43316/g.119804 Transcript_43316/m.119804 type:complete len:267 (+) Transcript_43316:162-962(+)